MGFKKRKGREWEREREAGSCSAAQGAGRSTSAISTWGEMKIGIEAAVAHWDAAVAMLPKNLPVLSSCFGGVNCDNSSLEFRNTP